MFAKVLRLETRPLQISIQFAYAYYYATNKNKMKSDITVFEELTEINKYDIANINFKKYDSIADWTSTLNNEDEKKIYDSREAFTFGMPCCGIASGHVLVRSDGTLARFFSHLANDDVDISTHWSQFSPMSKRKAQYPYGYRSIRPEANIKQGFYISAQREGLRPQALMLSEDGFSKIEFDPQYPVATIDYKGAREPLFPLDISAEVFSPFIPFDLRNSANPVTIYKFTVTNNTGEDIVANLGGYLENIICKKEKPYANAARVNSASRSHNMANVTMTVEEKLLSEIGTDLNKSANDYGDMSLSVIADNPYSAAVMHGKDGKIYTGDFAGIRYTDGNIAERDTLGESFYECHIAQEAIGYASANMKLKPSESSTVTFLISWNFPNFNNNYPNKKANIGRMYSNWYKNSIEVAEYVKDNFEYLYAETIKFRDTYYSSNLPYWFVQQCIRSLSTVATHPMEWWKDGSFHAMEGVVFCFGAPNHVWEYIQAVAYFFPEIEKNFRIKRDIGTALKDNGRLNFREFDDTIKDDKDLKEIVADVDALHEARMQWYFAADGQCGTILRFYREHLLSPDNSFLEQVWESVKKMISYLIFQDGLDGEVNGMITAPQHNTSDAFLVGANTFTGSGYLASLRACEEMAKIMGDFEIAKEYRRIFESGRQYTIDNLWNGEYFINTSNEELRTAFEAITYGQGCHIDQLFGQTWAFSLGLGYLYPENMVKTALKSLFKYNFVYNQDLVINKLKMLEVIGSQANPQDAGMLTCTYPKETPVEDGEPNYWYSEFTWSGFEYHAASAMIRVGLVEEGMAVYRAIYERYQPNYHNPYNEIEGGDHYTRAMAAYGGMLAISGFYCDTAKAEIKFAPKIQKDNFKVFYSTGNSYGIFIQDAKNGVNLSTKSGVTIVKTIELEVLGEISAVNVKIDGEEVNSSFIQDGNKLTINLDSKYKSTEVQIKFN